jgi:hypothetical protein
MATLERPLKEGSVRTYQAKVGLGFLDILASEVDADLDTIYAAWNGGIGTANLQNGAVTDAKIASVAWNKLSGGTVAASGDLAGSYPAPVVERAAGNFTATGFSVGRIYAGSIYNSSAQAYGTGFGQVALPTVAYDSGGVATAGTWQLVMPPWASWCQFFTTGAVDANTGAGIVLAIEVNTGAWQTVAQHYLLAGATVWAWGTATPFTSGSLPVRLTINNFTGASRTLTEPRLIGISTGKL